MTHKSITIAGISLLLLSGTSCTNKENQQQVLNNYLTPNVVDGSKHNELQNVTNKLKKEVTEDTLSTDSVVIDCYRWDREYTASTSMINDEDGEPFDLNILITLLRDDSNDEYYGGLVLYVDEENFIEAAIFGFAEGNHVTIYYKEDPENTTGELFKANDKLVQFEIADGEYTASWFAPMHNFVDEHTVISIR